MAEVRLMLASEEKKEAKEYPARARIIPYLNMSDVGDCYPNCDDDV